MDDKGKLCMPCFLLSTKHKEMANELHDRIQKSFPDFDKNVDSNNIEKFTLPNESCGSEITHIFASRVDKMTTEINRNMLCQFRILLLTHKINLSILTPSKSEFLSKSGGVLSPISRVGKGWQPGG